MEEKTYLYSVNPRKPIKNIPGITPFRTSRSLFLTKDQVLECCKCGTVYRRFSNDKVVKVTPAELDRLHRDTFISEYDFAKMNADSMGEARGKTKEVNPTVDLRKKKLLKKPTKVQQQHQLKNLQKTSPRNPKLRQK